MELEGQVAIVTGSGRGIGRAIALELAGMGAGVVVAEVDSATAERTAEEVRVLGRAALAVRVDVTTLGDLETMARRALDELGRIDILVNNAGIYRAALPLDIDEEHWDAVMEVNAKANFFASRAVLPAMRAAGRGNIISLASMAGKVGTPHALAYAASKAAVVSMTKSLALAYAAAGIRVNCVCPGLVETDMGSEVARQAGAGVMGLDSAEFHRQRVAQVPLGRLGQPEDVARVVGFLASEKSSYMTGQALNITGGVLMR